MIDYYFIIDFYFSAHTISHKNIQRKRTHTRLHMSKNGLGLFIYQVRDGYRLEKPEHCRRELYNIMYYCWAKNANERPSFSEMVRMLDKLLLTEMDYIELERFPDHNYYNIVHLSGEKVQMCGHRKRIENREQRN